MNLRPVGGRKSADYCEPEDFVHAIAESDIDKIKEIIATKIQDPNFQIETLLSYALLLGSSDRNFLSPVRPNYSEEVNGIIWGFIKSKIKDVDLLTLYAMLTHQTEAVVEDLIQSVTDVDATIVFDLGLYHRHEVSLLQVASLNGYYKIAKHLLDSGADVNHGDFYISSLYFACDNGNFDIVKLLLDHDALIHSRDLRVACEYNHLEVVSLLLARGANVNAQCGVHGNTPLTAALREGHLEITSLLLDRGADVNAQERDGDTPLIIAVDKGHLEFARLLLDRRAVVNAQGQFGGTPLTAAISEGHLEFARLLLDRGAVVNAPGFFDRTPLSYAVMRGQLEFASLLLVRGAMLNRDLLDAACVACDAGFPEAISFVLDRQAYLCCTKLSDEDTTQKTKLFLLQKCIEKMAVSDPPEGAEFRETLRELYTSVITPLCENDADLLLLLAIITQQPSNEIFRIISLGASIFGAEKYSQKPLSLADQFYPEAPTLITNLIENEVEVNQRNGAVEWSYALNFFSFNPDHLLSSNLDDALEFDEEGAGYDNPNSRKRRY